MPVQALIERILASLGQRRLSRIPDEVRASLETVIKLLHNVAKDAAKYDSVKPGNAKIQQLLGPLFGDVLGDGNPIRLLRAVGFRSVFRAKNGQDRADLILAAAEEDNLNAAVGEHINSANGAGPPGGKSSSSSQASPPAASSAAEDVRCLLPTQLDGLICVYPYGGAASTGAASPKNSASRSSTALSGSGAISRQQLSEDIRALERFLVTEPSQIQQQAKAAAAELEKWRTEHTQKTQAASTANSQLANLRAARARNYQDAQSQAVAQYYSKHQDAPDGEAIDVVRRITCQENDSVPANVKNYGRSRGMDFGICSVQRCVLR